MAETQRRPVPRNDDGELDTALAFLTFARESVLIKTEGLSDEQLRRVLVDTGTNLLGLVQHLTVAERYWFGHHLADVEPPQDWDYGMSVPVSRGTEEVLEGYRAASRRSDELIRDLGDPTALAVRPVDGKRVTLRWVLAHMTSETVRHAGHADILREQLDGTTGR
ncbi:DinB family protein [Dactylosporangium siamense]|nr:DinB family protein [Dactylosporangium siamense]